MVAWFELTMFILNVVAAAVSYLLGHTLSKHPGGTRKIGHGFKVVSIIYFLITALAYLLAGPFAQIIAVASLAGGFIIPMFWVYTWLTGLDVFVKSLGKKH